MAHNTLPIPEIELRTIEENKITFILTNTDVSIANCLRKAIVSEVPSPSPPKDEERPSRGNRVSVRELFGIQFIGCIPEGSWKVPGLPEALRRPGPWSLPAGSQAPHRCSGQDSAPTTLPPSRISHKASGTCMFRMLCPRSAPEP